MNLSSIHLKHIECSDILMDNSCISNMDCVRNICNAVLSIRKENGLKIKIPMPYITIYGDLGIIHSKYYTDIICDEVNVKQVRQSLRENELIRRVVKLNMNVCGKKFGNKIGKIKEKIDNNQFIFDGSSYKVFIDENEIVLDDECIITSVEVVDHHLRAKSRLILGDILVVLNTELNDELVDEGLLRDFIHFVQNTRKARNLAILDKISLEINDCSDRLKSIIIKNEHTIKATTLTKDLSFVTHNYPMEKFSTAVNNETFSASINISM